MSFRRRNQSHRYVQDSLLWLVWQGRLEIEGFLREFWFQLMISLNVLVSFPHLAHRPHRGL